MNAAAQDAGDGTFSAAERAAMKERAAELKAEVRNASAEKKAAAEREAFDAKIAEMPQPDRDVAKRLHEIVTGAAPELHPKLYYGQPGWAKAGKIIVFFRSGLMDKARYSTLGFSEEAALDEADGFWPTSYALEKLSDATEAVIAESVARAVG
ncbi:MAG TPA: DUF1801 domain-containing protein [Pseudolysinimonas sp.]|nr:DUF1801 domain-containing protein [Pseudolysinimonas sp.]